MPGRDAAGAVQTGALTRVSGHRKLSPPTVGTASSALRGLRDRTGRGGWRPGGGWRSVFTGVSVGGWRGEGQSWVVMYKGVNDPRIPCPSSGCHTQSNPTLRFCGQPPVLRPKLPQEALPRSHWPGPLLSTSSVPRVPDVSLSPWERGSDEVEPLGGAGGRRPPACPPSPSGAPSARPRPAQKPESSHRPGTFRARTARAPARAQEFHKTLLLSGAPPTRVWRIPSCRDFLPAFWKTCYPYSAPHPRPPPKTQAYLTWASQAPPHRLASRCFWLPCKRLLKPPHSLSRAVHLNGPWKRRGRSDKCTMAECAGAGCGTNQRFRAPVAGWGACWALSLLTDLDAKPLGDYFLHQKPAQGWV